MPKFRVTVTYVAYETETVEIEADDEDSIDIDEVVELADEKQSARYMGGYGKLEASDNNNFEIELIED